MKKLLLSTCLLPLFFGSCQPKLKEVDRTVLAEEYIQALNEFDYPSIISLFYDSVRMKEIVYETTFSKADYYNLFQWDSIFQPEYKVLQIQELPGEKIELQISKLGPRINFLMDNPIITKEVLSFEKGKIYEVEIIEYLYFDDETWVARRQALIEWVAANHPELDGFIYDQTKVGALNYLRAIELYKAANNQ